MSVNSKRSKQEVLKKQQKSEKLWVTILISGILLAVGVAIGISYIQEIQRFYFIGGIVGFFIFMVMFFRPEVGAYLLVITVFTNLSDLFTESGLPSINQPLAAMLLLVVVANLLFAPERLVPLSKISRIEWALLAYVLVAVLSYTVATDQVRAYTVILRLFKNVVIFFSIFLSLNTRHKVRTAIRILIVTMAILAIMGVIQFLSGTDFEFFGLAKRSLIGQTTEAGGLRLGGPIGLSNVWGQVLVVVLPFFIYRVIGTKNNSLQEVALLGSTIIIFLAIVLTGSRGAFVALITILPLIAIELKIKLPNIFIGLAVGTIILVAIPSEYTSRFTSLLIGQTETGASISEDDAVQGRLTKMEAGLQMFRENPFLGVGIGNYRSVYWDYADDFGLEPAATDIQSEDGQRDAHSLYIEIMAETGLFGISTFLLFLGFLLADTYKILVISKERFDDAKWKSWVAPLLFAMIAYMVSGIFLHGLVFRWFWIIASLALAAIHLTEFQYKNT